MTKDFEGARVVNNVSEEYNIISSLKCKCGGKYLVREQSLVENKGKFYDIISCECKSCEKLVDFIFDINSFFGKELMI